MIARHKSLEYRASKVHASLETFQHRSEWVPSRIVADPIASMAALCLWGVARLKLEIAESQFEKALRYTENPLSEVNEPIHMKAEDILRSTQLYNGLDSNSDTVN